MFARVRDPGYLLDHARTRDSWSENSVRRGTFNFLLLISKFIAIDNDPFHIQVHRPISVAGVLIQDQRSECVVLSLHRSAEEDVLVHHQTREGAGLDHCPSSGKDTLTHDQIHDELGPVCCRISGGDIRVHDQIPEKGSIEHR